MQQNPLLVRFCSFSWTSFPMQGRYSLTRPVAGKARAGQIQIFIFDARRGNREGHESEKVLAFYPASTPSDDQLGTVGLAQGFATFMSTFSGETDYQTLETDNTWWALRRFEAGIWFGVEAERDWGPGKVGHEALNVILTEMYDWATLLHGSVNKLLDDDPSAARAQIALQALAESWGNFLTHPKSSDRAELESPLGVGRMGGVPHVPLPRSEFLSIQFLMNSLNDVSYQGTKPVKGALVCFESYLLWSSFDLRHTRMFYTFLSRSSKLAGGKVVSMGAQLVRFMDGDGEKAGWLLPVQQGSLTVAVLLDSIVDDPRKLGSVLNSIVTKKSARISHTAATELALADRYHISGYRYAYIDRSTTFFYGSPQKKLKNLSKKTTRMLIGVQQALGRLPSTNNGDCGNGGESDCEITARGDNGGWIVARRGGPNSLFVALDNLQDSDIEHVDEHVSRLCDKHFPGALDV